jgi:predicted MFS family arabinose efflux permease
VRLFRRPAFTGANLVVFATFFGIFAIFFFVALYLQLIANASPYATALDFLPMAAGMIAASALTGRWVGRAGPRVPMTVGCVLGAAGILLTNAYLSPNVGLATLGWTLGIAGVGFGIAMVPVTAAILTVAPAERSGMAASVGNTSRELGAVFGVAVLGAVINAELTGHLVTQLQRLGIPANFQALVLHAVTHGGVPKTGPAGFGHSRLVMEVIHAAEAAFASGLNVALLLAGAMLAAGALIAAVTIRRTSEPASLLGAPPE